MPPLDSRRPGLEAALAEQPDGVSRRRFLELLGASLALAGAAACAPPREQILSYGHAVSAQPLFFATGHVIGGFADGVLVESHQGRPTKVEGNALHPGSPGGGTDAFAQASLLDLYDPGRADGITLRGQASTWADFQRELAAALAVQRASGGAGIRILSETVTSPTLAGQLQAVLRAFPSARWHRWQAVHHDNALAGAQMVFGEPLHARWNFGAADVVLLLDADPLAAWQPGHVRYTRELAMRRQPERGPLSRIYLAESTLSSLSGLADHRLAMSARAIEPLAWSVADVLGVTTSGAAPQGVARDWLGALVEDLRATGPRSLVLAGQIQPPAVHALAHAINAALGSIGTTIEYSAPVEVDPVAHGESLRTLVEDMQAGRVDLLLMLGGNPLYSAPADVPFGAALGNVAHGVYLGAYADETAERSTWHVPELHALETWADARSFDGTVTIQQPLIAPLRQGWSALDVLGVITGEAGASSHELVKRSWLATWQQSLQDGIVAGSALPARAPTLRSDWATGLVPPPIDDAPLEVVFRPDTAMLDGRYASNSWLMELPRPFTKLTWDNVAAISPATARRLGVASGDIVELRFQGRSVRAPIWELPGQADDSVSLPLGYGRWRGAGAGTGVGFNANLLRTNGAPWFAGGLEVRLTGQRADLASTQTSFTPGIGDPLAQGQPPTASLYPAVAYNGNAWGMVIDQSACVGCNACIVACQAENNIPVVGKEEVSRGRNMLWLRLDTYFSDADRPIQQLVPCMHCENAPCEVVCPVGATVHSDEGLNDMVYNRCVGTRYCSNNCPYKVRHFNFFEYSDFGSSALQMMRNPQVTVRTRGVMEKCTYCVQRISAARIRAEREDRPIADGEVRTACQAACPAGAIVFGNLNDPVSQVAQARASRRNYTLLAELNTRPRTTYLAEARNPNTGLGTA